MNGMGYVSFRDGTGYLTQNVPFFSPPCSQTASTSHAAAAPVAPQAPDGHEVGDAAIIERAVFKHMIVVQCLYMRIH